MKIHRIAAICAAVSISSAASAAEIVVLSSGAVKEALHELVPMFEKASGHTVKASFAGTVDIKKKMAAGEVFDVVIVASPEVDAFISQGKMAPGSRVDITKSSVGVAVRAGAPKPDLSSGEALKKALLAAKSVGYSTGPSGVYMQGLFQKMGIADAIKAKAKQTQPGVLVAKLIASGEVEIGFQQVSELIHEPGIQFLGALPADVNQVTVFSSGIHSAAKQMDAAKAMQKFLSSPAVAPVLKKFGLDPA